MFRYAVRLRRNGGSTPTEIIASSMTEREAAISLLRRRLDESEDLTLEVITLEGGREVGVCDVSNKDYVPPNLKQPTPPPASTKPKAHYAHQAAVDAARHALATSPRRSPLQVTVPFVPPVLPPVQPAAAAAPVQEFVDAGVPVPGAAETTAAARSLLAPTDILFAKTSVVPVERALGRPEQVVSVPEMIAPSVVPAAQARPAETANPAQDEVEAGTSGQVEAELFCGTLDRDRSSAALIVTASQVQVYASEQDEPAAGDVAEQMTEIDLSDAETVGHEPIEAQMGDGDVTIDVTDAATAALTGLDEDSLAGDSVGDDRLDGATTDSPDAREFGSQPIDGATPSTPQMADDDADAEIDSTGELTSGETEIDGGAPAPRQPARAARRGRASVPSFGDIQHSIGGITA